jgi:membrane fusion protein (multidrug efflux system)
LERAQLDEALANFERGQRLQKGAITESEFARLEALHKMAQARYQSAFNNVGQQIALVGVRRAELALAQQALKDAELVAPFDAVVERRHVSPGEYIQIGQPVVTLVRSDKLRYTAGVPETKADQVQAGQTIEIEVPGAGEPLVAKISRVSPAVTQTSRSLWIEADVLNPQRKLQAGIFAEAEIVVDPDARAIAVPAGAVTEFAGVQKVWVVRDGKAAELPVRIGRREPTRVEILDGLTAGEVIVRNSHEGRVGDVTAVSEVVVARPEVNADDSTGQEGLAE